MNLIRLLAKLVFKQKKNCVVPRIVVLVKRETTVILHYLLHLFGRRNKTTKLLTSIF